MKVLRIAKLLLAIYLVGFIALTPSSKLGGTWWACGLMVCSLYWLLESIESLRGRQ